MEPFLGEIRCFAFGRIPQSWLACNGQTLEIRSYQALYALIGVAFGGNGTTNFMLPNLNGVVPMHYNPTGNNPNAQTKVGGNSPSESIALTVLQMPAHNHLFAVGTTQADQKLPGQMFFGVLPTPHLGYAPAGNLQVDLCSETVVATGGNQAHNNMQPYLVTNFCIATAGDWPPQP